MGKPRCAGGFLRLILTSVVAGMCIGAAQVHGTPIPKARPYAPAVQLSPSASVPLRKVAPQPAFGAPATRPLSLVPDMAPPSRVVPAVSSASKCILRGWHVDIREPVNGAGQCGIKRPVSLRSVVGAGREIGLTLPVQIECGLAQEFDGWLQDVAFPAARREFGASIVRIRTAAGYACRGRNNQKGAKLSEHGKGNAIDIAGFYLSDGREVTVKDGWDGSSSEARFLSALHKGACERFTTVLGPNADKYHRDHLHFDLGCHGKGCQYRVCK